MRPGIIRVQGQPMPGALPELNLQTVVARKRIRTDEICSSHIWIQLKEVDGVWTGTRGSRSARTEVSTYHVAEVSGVLRHLIRHRSGLAGLQQTDERGICKTLSRR